MRPRWGPRSTSVVRRARAAASAFGREGGREGGRETGASGIAGTGSGAALLPTTFLLARGAAAGVVAMALTSSGDALAAGVLLGLAALDDPHIPELLFAAVLIQAHGANYTH